MTDPNPSPAGPNEPTRTFQPHEGGDGPGSITGAAPSLPPALSPRPPARVRAGVAGHPQFEDFDVLQVLGEGGFGQVLLARQRSLDRLVALKVTADQGQEGRTLASLEHEHIVQVYAEHVDRGRNLRWLCMQYVPGTNLARVIRELGQLDPVAWSGQALLDVVDRCCLQQTAFQPQALRDRQALAEADWPEAVCWLGARLAEALDHAHRRGVLHRDIKPANILINPYGRPFLADFNLAARPQGASAGLFGGTLAYMAPEHLEAFLAGGDAQGRVDARADLYALGQVLFELLTGYRPQAFLPMEGKSREAVNDLVAARRAGAPSARRLRPETPPALEATLRRCLDPDPEKRFANGARLAAALDGCRVLRRLARRLPAPGPLTARMVAHPFRWMLILVLLPQVIGSGINVAYNDLAILDPEQRALFGRLVLGYNLLIYPLCLAIGFRLVWPVRRAWRALVGAEAAPGADLDAARRQALTWPAWVVRLAFLGWLPGGVLFPLGLHWWAGPVGTEVFGHFLLSFTLSGLIAMTYSFFGVQYLVVRVLYLDLWAAPRDPRPMIAGELAGVESRLRWFQFFAGVIPLVGAGIMVGVGPELLGNRPFRLLVTALLGLSMVGFGIAVVVHQALAQVLAQLTAPLGGTQETTTYGT